MKKHSNCKLVFVIREDYFAQLSDFETIVVKSNADGNLIRVGDIATVVDGFEEDSVSTSFNGKKAMFLDVSRTGNQSVLEMASTVKNYIESKQADLPAGMYLTFWDDDSQALKNRLGILGKSALQGGILVILLLALFLSG